MADRGIAGPRIAKLGRYEVVSELGKGAMGIVYLAKDPVIGRMVAIKTIRLSAGGDEEDTQEFRERFVREAQTAGILSHPNIVTIHDIGEDPETQTSFIAMEYIEGKNLKMLLAEKTKFPFEQVSEIVAEVAEALDYAHRKGIIHRDVKPANIIITTDGKVKITDFGIAKIASSNLTTTGQFLGTPNYMSPEQVSGSPVDGRSDLFSLGVVLYELLTSRKPFQGDNLTAISYKIVHEDFTPPADLAPDVPTEFNDIVARAMAKDPWNRYQRGKDMALALYQLKAQLEERRSQEDLGTMITEAAENVPTLRLPNLKAIAESGGPEPRVTPAATPAVPDPGAGTRPMPHEGSGSFSQSGSRRPTVAATPAEVEPTVVASSTSPGGPTPTVPVRPLSGKERPPGKKRSPVAAIAIAAVLAALAIGGYFALRPKPGPSSEPPAAAIDTSPPNADAIGIGKSLEEGKRLYDEGKYEESLVALRTVLSRDPNNAEAKQLAGQAENAIKVRTEQTARDAQIASALDLARQSFTSKKWEQARDRADAVLVLDAQNAEATRLKADAVTQIEKAAAEKKKVEAQLAKIRATPKNAPQSAQNAQPMGPVAPPAPAAASNATLRLLFDSPISEGHVMVAINDQILLRRPYNFKKKGGLFSKTVEGTGTVSANIPVPTGPVTVKVWLSGPGITPAFGTTTASMLPSETRTLKVDYGGGQLGVRVQ
ncbi:MAG TPA: protein kinase [Thermoanaerobaculia bacterium]|nr:protein kinase [Thermoanaerobaculia bacterium]